MHVSPCVMRAHLRQSLYALHTVSSASTGGPWPGSDIGRSPEKRVNGTEKKDRSEEVQTILIAKPGAWTNP